MHSLPYGRKQYLHKIDDLFSHTCTMRFPNDRNVPFIKEFLTTQNFLYRELRLIYKGISSEN